MRRLIILPGALIDVDAAMSWSQAHGSTGDAEKLVAKVEDELHRLTAFPLAWPLGKLAPDVRARHLPKLRYSLHYRVSAEEITLVAFAHMRRRPGYWKNRM